MSEEWVAHFETSNGRTFVPGTEAGVRALFEEHRLRFESGVLLRTGGTPIVDVAGTLCDPDGAVQETFGDPVPLEESQLYEPLEFLSHDEWLDCKQCRRLICVGQAFSRYTRRCTTCVYADETDRPRPRKFVESTHIVPRPTKCVRCGSGTVKDRRHLRGAGWCCKDCASIVEAEMERGTA